MHDFAQRYGNELESSVFLEDSVSDRDTNALTQVAARDGHEGCLRALRELGAGASVSAKNAFGAAMLVPED